MKHVRFADVACHLGSFFEISLTVTFALLPFNHLNALLYASYHNCDDFNDKYPVSSVIITVPLDRCKFLGCHK